MKILTAAIQFGSSRICAAAAWRDELGHYEVAAIERESADGCIRHGRVVSIDATAVHIKSLMQKLSNKVKSQGGLGLDSAYVGMCCMSMHSTKHQPSIVIPQGMEVTKEVLADLQKQSLNMRLQETDILGLEVSGHHMDGHQVVGDHQIIVADKQVKEGFRAAMERAGVRSAGFICTPLQMSDLMETAERNDGCVLVDIGASLTTVLIYDNKVLKHMVVIPLGGDAVTQDICSLGIRADMAEDAKINWSDASRPSNVDESIETGLPIPVAQLNNIVACRYEEIADNVMNQIRSAGYNDDNMPSLCILTGGASMQRGLTNLFSQRLGIAHIVTRGCMSIRYAQSECKPRNASLMAMLKACTESCEIKQKTVFEPEPVSKEGPQVVIRQTPPPPVKTTTTPPPAKEQNPKKKNSLYGIIGDLFSSLDE